MSAVSVDMAIGDGPVVSDSMLIVAPSPYFVMQYLVYNNLAEVEGWLLYINFVLAHVCLLMLFVSLHGP